MSYRSKNRSKNTNCQGSGLFMPVFIFSIAALVGAGLGTLTYLASLQSQTVAEYAYRVGFPVRAQETVQAMPNGTITIIDSEAAYQDPFGKLPLAEKIPNQELTNNNSETAVIPLTTPPITPPIVPPTTTTSDSNSRPVRVNDGGSIRVNTTYSTKD